MHVSYRWGKKGRKKRLEELSREIRTMVFYESPHKILKTINDLNNRNNLELSKYIKYIFNRKDKIKIEFEVFQSDVNEDPKEIILNLKSEILRLL